MELILKTAGGEIASKLKDVYARKTPQEILLSWAAVEKKLAVKIPAAKITDYLKKLGFAVKFSDKDKIKVQIPSWRVDIGAEADLIEEIARLYGYNNLPESLPSCRNSDYSIRVTRGKNFRQAALALGYTEICNFSFVNKEFYLAAGLPNLLKVLNPVSSETEYLRPDFLYGMLKTLKTNHDNNPSRHGYKFFETGRCFLPDNNNEYKEFSAAGFLTAGAPGQTNWINTPRPADFYDLSGDIAAFLKKCGYKSNIEISGDLLFSPGGIISAADVPIGRIGHLADNIIKAADAGFSDIFYAFIDLDRLPQSAHKTRKFRPLSAFPASFRDLAFVLKQNISAASITEFIRNFSEYITGCTLISLYRGEAIEKDSVSAAFSIEYRRSDKTMQKGEIDEIENRLIKIITEKFSARLR
ncbi:MAG TPA: hypothetical protein DC049_14205 [Spirochaetia bacterium]|nr:hypothetical protein [Spirochaetia bacterium]